MKRPIAMVIAALSAAIGLTVVAPASPAAADTTRDRIVQIANGEYNNTSRNHEVNSSSTEDCNFYTGAMGRPSSACPNSGWGNVDWCADFVRYVWQEAGNIAYLDELDSFAHSLRTYGVEHGTWHTAGGGYVPQPGDAFAETDGNGNGMADHTGLVISYDGNGNFTTIEGNIAPSGDRRQSRIVRRSRNVNDSDVWGFSSPVLNRPDDPVPVVRRVGVSGVAFAGMFHEFFRRADNTVIHHVYTPGDDGGWAADRDIAGAIASPPVATVHDGQMFVFARGTDNQLKYRFHTGSAWDTTWRGIPGGFSGTPAVAVRQDQLFVFIRSGSAVMYRFHDAGVGWNSDGQWRALGAPSSSVSVVSDPVTAFIGERMYVFVRGSDSRIWTRYHDANGWGPWGALAGAVAGQPTAVTNGNTIYVFARTASNEILYHYHAVGASAWTTARSLDGDVRGNPAAVSAGGTLLIAARNAVGEIVYRAHDGSAWTTWRELGRHSAALIDSSPVAFRHGDSAVVAARGTDARLYSRQWNPSRGWNDWGALPGNHLLNP